MIRVGHLFFSIFLLRHNNKKRGGLNGSVQFQSRNLSGRSGADRGRGGGPGMSLDVKSEGGDSPGESLERPRTATRSLSTEQTHDMYTTERRRMSLYGQKRKDPVWVSAGSLWQDSAIELSSSGKQIVSPRSRNRAVSVAYIVNQDAEHAPQENLSLTCMKEACANTHAAFKSILFERISMGTTDVLDSFYNAGKCRHAARSSRTQRFYAH